MRRFTVWGLVLPLIAATLLLAGCSTPAKSGGPSSASVWKDTLATKSYQEWKKAPGYETQRPAKGPHGKMVEIYVNPTIEKTLSGSGASAWPSGSIIVKDAFDGSGKPVSVEYMQKTDGGWYYASFKPDGTASKEGVRVAPCQPCHGKGSDSVLSFKLPS